MEASDFVDILKACSAKFQIQYSIQYCSTVLEHPEHNDRPLLQFKVL